MHNIAYVLQNIRKQRVARRLTQEYMGLRLGVGQNAYSKLELGITKINIDHLLEIALVFNVEPIKLLTEPKEKKKRPRFIWPESDLSPGIQP
jgi:transcriptional regulator with XRE-family HTH domain